MHKPDRVVVLDTIRSLYNVGSIIRTSDAFGVNKVILCGYTPSPDHKRFETVQNRDPDSSIAKTALKGLRTVEWERADSVVEAVKNLKDAGYFVAALEEGEGSQPLVKTPPEPFALILGNELDGVSPEVLGLCDTMYEIPMQGEGKSLNVAVAYGIAAHTLFG